MNVRKFLFFLGKKKKVLKTLKIKKLKKRERKEHYMIGKAYCEIHDSNYFAFAVCPKCERIMLKNKNEESKTNQKTN